MKTSQLTHNQWGKKNLKISSKIQYKAKMSTLSISIQHSTGITSKSNQRRERDKRHSNKKGKRKIMFADGTVLYIENSTHSIKKTIRINK